VKQEPAFLLASIWTLAAAHSPNPHLYPAAILLACYWGVVFLARITARDTHAPARPHLIRRRP
jgi:hypothetical protein